MSDVEDSLFLGHAKVVDENVCKTAQLDSSLASVHQKHCKADLPWPALL